MVGAATVLHRRGGRVAAMSSLLVTGWRLEEAKRLVAIARDIVRIPLSVNVRRDALRPDAQPESKQPGDPDRELLELTVPAVGSRAAVQRAGVVAALVRDDFADRGSRYGRLWSSAVRSSGAIGFAK